QATGSIAWEDQAEELMLTTVPVIDLAPFMEGSSEGKKAVAAAVGRACTDIGFFSITGHGVPEPLIERMYDVSRRFFDLPLPEKLAVKRPKPEQSRGYIGFGDENLAYSLGKEAITDLKEFFAIGPVDVPDEDYYHCAAAYPSFARSGRSITARSSGWVLPSCAFSRWHSSSPRISLPTRRTGTSAASASSTIPTRRRRPSPGSSAPAPTPTSAR